MKLLENIHYTLNNENGGPNVEQVIGISASLFVGVGLFLFGRHVYRWYNGSAGNTVDGIETPNKSVFSISDWY